MTDEKPLERKWDPPLGRPLADGKCKYPECHCQTLCLFAGMKIQQGKAVIKFNVSS